MSNVTTGNPLVIDTEGVISAVPLVIRGILLKPNATGDSATFTYWYESDDPITNGDKKGQTVSVTASSGTFSSTGNFPTDNVNPNQIMRVIHTSSGNNVGYWQIATNADNNTITVDNPAQVLRQPVTLTDDTSKIYTWKIWEPRILTVIRGSGLTGDTSLNYIPFDDGGVWVPNLAMHSLSTSAVLYVFLK